MRPTRKINTPSRSKSLYLYQNKRCYWCGFECLSPTLKFNEGQKIPRNAFTREHIIPKHTKHPHTDKWWNIVGACNGCNGLRAHLDTPGVQPTYGIRPEDIRFARMTGIDPTGGRLTEWIQERQREIEENWKQSTYDCLASRAKLG